MHDGLSTHDADGVGDGGGVEVFPAASGEVIVSYDHNFNQGVIHPVEELEKFFRVR